MLPRVSRARLARCSASALCVALAAACSDGVGVPIRRAALDARIEPAPDEDDDASREEGDRDSFDEDHCAPAAAWPAQLVQAEDALLDAINVRRRQRIRCGERERDDLLPLRVSPALRCSARLHSLDMVQRDFTGRTNPDGDGPSDRMRAAGLRVQESDESIVVEDGSADSVLQDLLEDWDDCMNVATDDLTHVGIGRYQDRWTLDFASD